MSGLPWEQEVANYLEEQGYSTTLRKTIRGHEMDVYATNVDETLIVECKDWNSNVTPDSVRRSQKVAEEVGGTPAIAYTSDLSSGTKRLAERWDFIKIPAEIVRGETTRIEDVKSAAQDNEICLPNVDDLSKLDDPLGPFIPDEHFAEKVAETSHELTLESLTRSERWIKDRVISLCSEHEEADACVPVLRHDSLRVVLYFINTNTHSALPDKIAKEKLELG